MRVLITGGFGFIGGRLARYLQSCGHEILLGSRRSCKPPDCLARAEVVKIDWTDSSLLDSICANVDAVVHAAGMNAQECAADPVSALDFNGVATARLARAAAMAGVGRFIYLSTAHVYAAPLEGEIDEGTCPRNLHPYASSHLAGENAVLDAGQRHGMGNLVLRISNAFGAPIEVGANCWMLLVNDLCRQAVTTGKLKLLSSGSQKRDFVPMAEVCKAVNTLLTDDQNRSTGTVLNLGAGMSMTVLQMAERIQAQCTTVLGFEPIIVRPAPEADEVVCHLAYHSRLLQQRRIMVDPSPDKELRELLQFCRSNF